MESIIMLILKRVFWILLMSVAKEPSSIVKPINAPAPPANIVVTPPSTENTALAICWFEYARTPASNVALAVSKAVFASSSLFFIAWQSAFAASSSVSRAATSRSFFLTMVVISSVMESVASIPAAKSWDILSNLSYFCIAILASSFMRIRIFSCAFSDR